MLREEPRLIHTHTAGSEVETTVEMPPGGDQDNLAALSGLKFLADLVQRSEMEETCTSTVPAKIVVFLALHDAEGDHTHRTSPPGQKLSRLPKCDPRPSVKAQSADNYGMESPP